MAIRIILADDHKIIRDGLRSMLEKNQQYKVAGEAADGRTAVQLCREFSPDLVILDISMPDLNGVDATHRIKTDHPNVKVIALSMHSDQNYILRMLEAGASGYLLKDSAFDELISAINTVVAGRIYLSPAVTGIVVENALSKSGKVTSTTTELSHREREVLQLLAEGSSTKQIAARLNVSVKTVETHRRQIMEKLDIHSVAELTKYAVRQGLTNLNI